MEVCMCIISAQPLCYHTFYVNNIAYSRSFVQLPSATSLLVINVFLMRGQSCLPIIAKFPHVFLGCYRKMVDIEGWYAFIAWSQVLVLVVTVATWLQCVPLSSGISHADNTFPRCFGTSSTIALPMAMWILSGDLCKMPGECITSVFSWLLLM